MTYIFMAVHYPAPGRLDDVYASMRHMAESAASTPGLLEIGPWIEHDRSRVVGVSRWESRAAFEAAMPGSGVPNDITHPGESKPREYFHLESGPAPEPA
jgi:heme-degrading monooxygenase HmoA